MARYKLTLAYDGTDFYGSQRQSGRRTVQAELEKAARQIGWDARSIILAGRTDTGVHAIGQIAAVDLEWRHTPEALRDGLNANLPQDLAVMQVERVHDGFHPRFDAVSRRYRYDLRCAQLRHPLEDRLAWRVWPAPKLVRLNRAAHLFVGEHDFGAFGSPARKGAGTRRKVTLSKWVSVGDALRYEIAADGFLFRMVRRLVYLQVAVGQGRCTQEALSEALAKGRGASAPLSGTAPARGLRLVGVEY